MQLATFRGRTLPEIKLNRDYNDNGKIREIRQSVPEKGKCDGTGEKGNVAQNKIVGIARETKTPSKRGTTNCPQVKVGGSAIHKRIRIGLVGKKVSGGGNPFSLQDTPTMARHGYPGKHFSRQGESITGSSKKMEKWRREGRGETSDEKV